MDEYAGLAQKDPLSQKICLSYVFGNNETSLEVKEKLITYCSNQNIPVWCVISATKAAATEQEQLLLKFVFKE